jgi:hypothetical protein
VTRQSEGPTESVTVEDTGPIPVVPVTETPARSRRRATPPSNSAVLSAPLARGTVRRPTPRRARLTLTRVDPWSVLKATLVFTSCLLVVWMVAVLVLYGILAGAGVFDSVNQTLSDVLATHVDFNGPVVIFGALILGAFNVILMSALATVAAFAYNITAGLIGGLDVTLAEHE